MIYGVDSVTHKTSSGETVTEFGVVHLDSGRVLLKYPYDGLAIAKARALNARAAKEAN